MTKKKLQIRSSRWDNGSKVLLTVSEPVCWNITWHIRALAISGSKQDSTILDGATSKKRLDEKLLKYARWLREFGFEVPHP